MPHQHYTSPRVRKCIDHCLECFHQCSETIQHCLALGGEHASGSHIALLQSCADLCQVTAQSMLIGSPAHPQFCLACAEVCTACAEDCDGMEGDFLRKCARVCRVCAKSCRELSEKRGKEKTRAA